MQQQNKILAQSSRWLVISVRVFDDYYTDTDTVWNSMHITQPKKSEERKNARERESERWKWKGRYSIGVSVVWALLKKKQNRSCQSMTKNTTKSPDKLHECTAAALTMNMWTPVWSIARFYCVPFSRHSGWICLLFGSSDFLACLAPFKFTT